METEWHLHAISPLDGRYHSQCKELNDYVSEFALMRYRVQVEIQWFLSLSEVHELKEIPALSAATKQFLNNVYVDFNEAQAQQVKHFEKKINHDVKAIEYFLKDIYDQNKELAPVKEFVHFACTSEDINNLSYALMLKDLREKILLPNLETVISQLRTMMDEHRDTPMLSRTHGQVATPTTVGKEIANVIYRLQRQLKELSSIEILGKINGAVGNFNAHLAAYPNLPWAKISQQCVENLGLTYNPLTTQIEPHDGMAEYFHCLKRINTILIDFSRDVWGYISLGYFKQKVIQGEVGSSTMPHKVNPIDFENAEGNLGIANALLGHFADKLPISRWQRDLSDSTVQRNIGLACGYMLIALKALQKGINKLSVDVNCLAADLNQNWEVLAEAIQTVMRRYGIAQPYEKLKELTRDKKVNEAGLRHFIDSLELPLDVKQQLMHLTPQDYIGLAKNLIEEV